MKKFAFASGLVSAVSAAASVAATGAAYACAGLSCPPAPTPVPEISALEGTAAIAAMAAIVLLTWERRRRAH
ncbi:hypothetical protein [Paracoccus shandongensis]|uniref:hypothetical protein n=1 Tax=Paracoccus shandongensis TaxID=2816048 RepID=UPI001A8C9372|nr:hypothetical protein [Paracoccus shandongensis]